MMEARVAKLSGRAACAVLLLVLSAVNAETFYTDVDSDNPMSTGTLSSRTSGFKRTSDWPGGEAAAVDPSGGLRETDVPASESLTGAGRSEEPSHVSTQGVDQTTRTTSDTTEQLRLDMDLTHNATSQWEVPSAHSVSSYPAVSDVQQSRTERDVSITDLRAGYTNTDTTYVSTTNRAGERTLLSITSNSTSSYTQDSNSSGAVSQSAVSEYTEPTFQDHDTTNATQDLFSESKESSTDSETATHNFTIQTLEVRSEDVDPKSTTSLTSIQTVKIDVSSMSYTEANESVSTTSSFTQSESGLNTTSQQLLETTVTDSMGTEATGFSTGSDTSIVQERKSYTTHTVHRSTIQGLTTEPPTTEDEATTADDSLSRFLDGQPPFVPETKHRSKTHVLRTTLRPSSHSPDGEEETTETFTLSRSTSTISTTVVHLTTSYQPTTSSQTQTELSTLATTDDLQVLQTSRPMTQHPSPPGRSQTPGASQSNDVTTLHLETSTATPGNTTAQGRPATTPYIHSPTRSTSARSSWNQTDAAPEARVVTTQTPSRSTSSPGRGRGCGPESCVNGGRCVETVEGRHHCQCLPAWTGSHCTEDVDECVSSPCPQGSECVNTWGSFSCECALGLDLEGGRTCTQVKTFLGTFSVNNSLHLRSSGLHELHREILQLLNASLSILHGYRRSTLRKKNGEGVQISAVNMFSLITNVSSSDVFNSIQMSLSNCSRTYSHCTIKLQHQLSYHVESLCVAQKTKCDLQYSKCIDANGSPYCQCHPGYFKKNPGDMTCRDCGDGLKLVNGICVECTFGFGGFNCSNFYKLIAVVVSPAGGALLLIVVIALIVTCCKKDKNDINKIIFKSGELQMSPYAEFPKSNRVSMEWGRETIEMQENGSTKNLLQMTDIYYSPALRNSDLERNGLYPFYGLPGSRHSCIYPAQWNPSFTSDDSRRRDYF